MEEPPSEQNEKKSPSEAAPDTPGPQAEEHVTPQPSVMDVLERLTGQKSKVLLRDEVTERDGTPMILPGIPDVGSVPPGRDTYQIVGELARGGVGVILKGHDVEIGRDVAMKVLREDRVEHPSIVQRFIEEAQIGGQMQHPGIVPVYEIGVGADERPYFTMKLIKGRTLAELLSERDEVGTTRRRFLTIFEQICQTIAYAHARGVIHRDLKPANIMVGAFGEVLVVDWGLAKVLAGEAGDAETERRSVQTDLSIIETIRSAPGSIGTESVVGSVMGTPAYMPPEQALGQIERVDERSDVFSLGAILCEILTGKPPYLGEADHTIVDAAEAKQDSAYGRLEAADVDPKLLALVKRCLAPAQAARPKDAGVLASAIQEHVSSVEERAQEAQLAAAEAEVKARAERKARRLTLAIAGTVILTAVVGGAGWHWVERSKANAQRQTEREVAKTFAVASEHEARADWAGALAAISEARSHLEAGEANETLAGRVADRERELQEHAAEAARIEALEEDNAELIADLLDVRMQNAWTGAARAAQDFASAFSSHDLPLDTMSDEEAVQALEGRGIAIDLAGFVDDWAGALRASGESVVAAHLTRVSRAADPDPQRRSLRSALLDGRRDELQRLSARGGLSSLPAETLDLLGVALEQLGERDLAIKVLRDGVELRPDHLPIYRHLASYHLRADPPENFAAFQLLTAARALAPESHGIRRTLETVAKSLEEAR